MKIQAFEISGQSRQINKFKDNPEIEVEALTQVGEYVIIRYSIAKEDSSVTTNEVPSKDEGPQSSGIVKCPNCKAEVEIKPGLNACHKCGWLQSKPNEKTKE